MTAIATATCQLVAGTIDVIWSTTNTVIEANVPSCAITTMPRNAELTLRCSTAAVSWWYSMRPSLSTPRPCSRSATMARFSTTIV